MWRGEESYSSQVFDVFWQRGNSISSEGEINKVSYLKYTGRYFHKSCGE